MTGRPAHESFDDPLTKWEHWIDRAIIDAQEWGEFDNLPGRGNLLQLDDNPYAGEWAMGFHVLKNAGMAPLWMEFDKENQALRSQMHDLLNEIAEASPTAPATSHQRDRPSAAAHRGSPLRWPWSRSDEPPPETASVSTRREIERSRVRARRTYQELTARLDEKLRVYNRAFPADLQRLQRPRLPVDEAEASDPVIATAERGSTDDPPVQKQPGTSA